MIYTHRLRCGLLAATLLFTAIAGRAATAQDAEPAAAGAAPSPVPIIEALADSVAGKLPARAGIMLPAAGEQPDPAGYVAFVLQSALERAGRPATPAPQPMPYATDGHDEEDRKLPACFAGLLARHGAQYFLLPELVTSGPDDECTVMLHVFELPEGTLQETLTQPCTGETALTALRQSAPDLETRTKQWLTLLRAVFSDGPPVETAKQRLTLAHAQYMLEARRWSAAAQAYARLADQTPDRAFMHRTFALQMTGRSERARETVEEAIKLHPGSGPLYALQAWLQLHGKRPEDALPLIAQARRSDMTREGLYVYAHGLISLALNDDETAAANFFRAAELLPNHAFAQVRVARLYRAAGETDKALHAYRAAADAAHTDVQVWAELALAMEGADQLNGAVGTLRRALQNNPANPHVARSLAGLLMQQGNYDAARKVLAGAAEAAACNPDLHKDHGDAARTMWKLEEAAEAYRTAMRIAQNPHPAAVKLAHIHRVRREYRDAADRLADVLADEATGPALRASALIEKAQLLVEAGSAEQAVALLQEAAGLAGGEGDGGPALVEAYLAIGTPQATDAALRHAQLAIAARDSSTNRAALARALLAAGNPDKALEAAESALQADKHCRTALRTAAEAHLAGDDTEAARRSVERALELNPYDEDALRLLGHVELQADRPSKCVEAWRDALDINPWDGALHRMLAEVLSTDLDEREAALHHIDRSAELRKARESFQPE